MRAIGAIITVLCFCFNFAFGQKVEIDPLQFSYPVISHPSTPLSHPFSEQSASLMNAQRIYLEPIKRVSSIVIPQYVRENPTGYSYLCRLELQIERDLPIGVWFRVGDTENSPVYSPTRNAHVQFKLFNF